MIHFKWMHFIDVTWVFVDNSNITLLTVWFTSQRKVFNLKMAHERAETCRWDILCKDTSVVYVWLLWLRFFRAFPCKANARVKPAKTGHGPHSSLFLSCSMYFLCCSMYFLFCVVLCIICVYMCTVLLQLGGYPVAAKYIISYLMNAVMKLWFPWNSGTGCSSWGIIGSLRRAVLCSVSERCSTVAHILFDTWET